MARYIDADLLMKELGITDPDCEKCGWGQKGFSYCTRDGDFVDACVAICDAPTADVVERKDLDKVAEAHEQIGYEKGYRDGYAQADVVEVVRCEDCVHHKNAPQTTGVWCERLDGLLPKDWFCADGERREE